jgi:hypothetical protein
MAVPIEAALRTFLLTLDAVTAWVGTGDTARIRPDKLEEDDDETEEHVILEVDNEEPQNDLTGKGGLVYADLTVRCRAATKSAARALAEAVRTNNTDPGTGLAGYHGTAGGLTFDAVLEDQVVSFTPAGEGSDRGYYDVHCNYKLSCAETT